VAWGRKCARSIFWHGIFPGVETFLGKLLALVYIREVLETFWPRGGRTLGWGMFRLISFLCKFLALDWCWTWTAWGFFKIKIYYLQNVRYIFTTL
jgi:hypothetical protein